MKEALERADRFIGQLMSTVGLDVDYSRAEGDTLTLTTAGGEQAVTDFLGGFGSLILGHHHPDLVAHVQAFLDARRPVHAQFSRNEDAQRVTARLNAIARREFGFTDDGYAAVFGNSGAEGIEIALKHAELDRFLRAAGLAARLAQGLAVAQEAVTEGTAVLSPAARELAGAGDSDEGTAVAALAAAVTKHNDAQLLRPPVFLAAEGGFHGKLVGSLGVTHNPQFRAPFQAVLPSASFFPLDSPSALRALIAGQGGTVLSVVLDDGVVHVEEHPAPVFGGVILEPIQGEGGVRPLSADIAKEFAEICREHELPIVIDEIQTGSGRTGSFFASAQIELRGDYYVLAKSLGGGVAKTSVTLIRTSRYRKEFEALHSSTFAKDGLSTSVALKVLDLLEAGDGEVYRRVTERGARLTEMLESVREDFPDVIADVRGRGLLLGLEFHDQSAGASPLIGAKSRSGLLGFMVAGYLLNVHRLRLMPTGSSPNTIRLQPSAHIDDAAIDRLEAGLRDVCEILSAQDALHLVHPVAGRGPVPRTEIRRFAASAQPPSAAESTIALVTTVSTAGELRRFDLSLADLDDATLENYLALHTPARALPPGAPVRTGDVDVLPIPFFVTVDDLANDSAAVLGDLHGVLYSAGPLRVVLDRRLGALAQTAGLAVPVADTDLTAVLDGDAPVSA